VKHRVVLPISRTRDSWQDWPTRPATWTIGLVISNAGTGNPARFIDKEREELAMTLRLSALAHAELALHFGRKLAKRGTGGLLFVGAWVPTRASRSWRMTPAARPMSRALAWRSTGVQAARSLCNRAAPGLTDTPVLAKFGLDLKTMPIKAMKVDQAVTEGLMRSPSIRQSSSGRMNRIMHAILPGTVTRT